MQDLFCILFRKTVTAQAQQLDILPTRCHTRQKPEKASCGIILQLAMFFLRLQSCDSMPETMSIFRTNATVCILAPPLHNGPVRESISSISL